MKKNLILSMMMLAVMSTSFVSCSSDDDPVIVKNGTVTLEMPINVTDVVLKSFEGTATDVQTGKAVTLPTPVKDGNNYVITIPEIEEGNYNIAAKGAISFLKDGIAGTTDFEVSNTNVLLSEKSNSLKLAVNSFQAEGGFVISEIFFTGTTTPENKPYINDQYMVITNNSDVTLYADSIAILQSEFQTNDKQDYTPDKMSTDFSVNFVFMIPGSGTTVPVAPGQSLLVAINAINHVENNPNSFDLSGADYEFFDESSNPNYTDVDGTAKNLDRWYTYSATVTGFHNRGFKSYAIAKMKTGKDTWLKDYAYTAEYVFTFNEYSFPMSTDTYRVPNDWILDAVNLSVESEFQWIVTSSALDAGWTYCGKVDKDPERYNKAVIRKQDANGKYIDTNNSTNDFNAEVKPSMMK
jgi:hypothetical protein